MVRQYNEGAPLVVKIGAAVLLILVLGAFLWLFGTYRVEQGQGGILTNSDGSKTAINEYGWKYRTPFLTGFETHSLVNNNIYFPADLLELEQKFQSDNQAGAIGIDVKTLDDKVIDTGAVMSFEIVDLIQFGVKNTRPYEQLQKAFDGVTFDYLQSQTAEKLTAEITKSNAEALAALKASGIEKQFGIRINSFSLIRPTFTKKALDGLAEKQSIQAISEGKLNAARNEALGIEAIANAMKNQSDILKNIPPEQMQFNAKMALYGNLKGQSNVIWVVPEGQPLTIANKQ